MTCRWGTGRAIASDTTNQSAQRPLLLDTIGERRPAPSDAADAGPAHRSDVRSVVGDDPQNARRPGGAVDDPVRLVGVEGDVVAAPQRLLVLVELDHDLTGDHEPVVAPGVFG